MKIALLVIATNKYKQFLQPLIDSADKFFLKNFNVEYFIFTDLPFIKINSKRKINSSGIAHRPWPFSTLLRFRYFLKEKRKLSDFDYIFYCDADMLFVSDVGPEIISDSTSTIHPGFNGSRGTPETRKSSTAFIPENIPLTYFAGGFFGANSNNFLKMSKEISENINLDLENNIIAIWHDESHMNRYFCYNPPSKILPFLYCYPENYKRGFGEKLLALEKNHSEVRS